MLTSKPRIENPVPNGGTRPTAPLDQTSGDSMVPSDPGRTGTPGPLEPMTVPRVLDESGTDLLTGEASAGSTINSTSDRPSPTDWRQVPNPTATHASPEPVWQASMPQPASHGHSGTHPALR